VLALALLFPAAALARVQKKSQATQAKKSTGKRVKSSKKAKPGKKSARKSPRRRGQQAMDSERVREIQAALIRERYLDGQPNGVWDQRSRDAMQRYQGANGWQTKVVPDSRALIKLGLGPDHANLLNPNTAALGVVPGGGASRTPTPQQ
jgi:peptidoglycan hydrolase-like protein with peptidoglycan-binding domain